MSVVAVNGKRRSPFRFKSINNLLGNMPIQAALWTSEQKAEAIDAWVCSHLKYNYETYGLTKKAVIGGPMSS